MSDYTLFAGPAFTGADVRAFVLPTYSEHWDVFNTASLPNISDQLQLARSWEGDTAFPMAGANASVLQQVYDECLQSAFIENLVGISLSTHRDKIPVYNLGRMNPKAFVGSRRTTAGTMVFWLRNESPISSLLSVQYQNEMLRPDELPPFDLFLTFINDQGSWASCIIQGITILDEGTTIEMMNPEGIPVTYSFMALSATPIREGYGAFTAPQNVGIAPGQYLSRVSGSVRKGEQ